LLACRTPSPFLFEFPENANPDSRFRPGFQHPNHRVVADVWVVDEQFRSSFHDEPRQSFAGGFWTHDEIRVRRRETLAIGISGDHVRRRPVE
jgi:hypothetical protein